MPWEKGQLSLTSVETQVPKRSKETDWTGIFMDRWDEGTGVMGLMMVDLWLVMAGERSRRKRRLFGRDDLLAALSRAGSEHPGSQGST